MIEGNPPASPKSIKDIPFRGDSLCSDPAILSSELYAYLHAHSIQELTDIQKKALIPMAVHTALVDQECRGAARLTWNTTNNVNRIFRQARDGKEVRITQPQFERTVQQLRAKNPIKDKPFFDEQLAWYEQYSMKMKIKNLYWTT